MLSESNCGEGLSGWIRKSSSFWLTKYHKCPGGSAATLIKHIRQLTGEYLQRTLRLSLDLAQEINSSPDRYNPWQIWGIGAGVEGGGRGHEGGMSPSLACTHSLAWQKWLSCKDWRAESKNHSHGDTSARKTPWRGFKMKWSVASIKKSFLRTSLVKSYLHFG